MQIVVPLDLSDTSAEAIPHAAALAEALGDEILLVTVAGSRIRTELAELAEAEHDAIPDIIEARLKGVEADMDIPASHLVLRGEQAAEALIDQIRADDTRMIVMATHGRTGARRWRMGSVTDRVVRHATVPVLVVPTR